MLCVSTISYLVKIIKAEMRELNVFNILVCPHALNDSFCIVFMHVFVFVIFTSW